MAPEPAIGRRAGTSAACMLVETGLSPRDAITLVRWIRLGAIQSAEQEALLGVRE